jgi:hypothetical protein
MLASVIAAVGTWAGLLLVVQAFSRWPWTVVVWFLVLWAWWYRWLFPTIASWGLFPALRVRIRLPRRKKSAPSSLRLRPGRNVPPA